MELKDRRELMKMNNNLEKVCRFLIENKIANEDLVVGFDENLVIYKDFEWDLNSKYTEVEVKDYDGEYEELVIEDCDSYKLIVDCYGHLEVETPEEAIGEIDRLLEVNKDLAKKCELLDEAIEHFKSMKEYADLCNKVYLNTMLTGVR
ncbi:hypothetical protein [Clostridium saudiense]|uniref:hypothetical protein n=1 Tax=Clostridium saudiense TaxID=1414720 RepID=UPI00266EFE08|nr:hypothetical protein [Clostridium saudiense]